MNDPGGRWELVRYWLEKSDSALAAAQRDHQAGDLALAINRAYYACFYAVCGVLAAEGVAFRKHSAVRAAFHQRLVKEGRMAPEWGVFYNQAFDDRQEADYEALVEFDDATVSARLFKAKEFLAEMKRLLKP